QQAAAAGAVLAAVVGGQDGAGAAAFGVEAPAAVPAADVENRPVAKVDGLQVSFDEPPDLVVAVGPRPPRPGLQAVAEVELVIPVDRVDPGLLLRHGRG